MSKPPVDPDELHRYLADGHTQTEAAGHFGVSASAISQRVKKLQIATSKVLTLEKAADVVDRKLSATERLERAQQVILDQLDWAEQKAQHSGADRSSLTDLIVKLSAEIRGQLRLEHDISRTLIDLRVVREFQRTVFETIAEESPDTARRILARLKNQQKLRRSVELPTLDGHGGLGAA